MSISSISRRQALGLIAGAAPLPFICAPAVAAPAQGRVVVSTWGGDYGAYLASIIEKPLLAPSGIEAIQDAGIEPTRIAKAIAQRRLPAGTIDVISVQGPAAYDLEQAGMLEPLDQEKVPNLKHVLPEFANTYSIPQIYSPQVLAYNPERVSEAPTTFSDMEADRFKGKVGLFENSYLWLAMALALKHKDDVGLLAEVKPQVEALIRNRARVFTSTEAFAPALKSGEIDIGPLWYARVLFWKKAGLPIQAAFPKEGCLAYVTSLCVLKNAPNKAAAFAYLNAALDPAAQRGFAEKMSYHPTVSNASLDGELGQQLALPTPAPKLVPAPYPKLSAVRDDINDWWRRLLERG